MTLMILMLVLAPVVSLLFIGVVVLVIVSAFRSGSDQPLPADPSIPVSLYARVYRPTRAWSPRVAFDRTASGRISVAEGFLRWEPDEGERWAAALGAVCVIGLAGAGTLHSDPYVDVEIEGSGPWRLVVSDRAINRFVGNDFKRFREARRAREFADLLVRGGARAAQAGR
jgi:hypothetical protein